MFPLGLASAGTHSARSRTAKEIDLRVHGRSLKMGWDCLNPAWCRLPTSQLCPPTKRRTRSLTHRRRAVRAWERF